MYYPNNFYGFFPEGFLRGEFYSESPFRKKIIEEIDRLIIETNFDLEKYLQIHRTTSEATGMISKLYAKAREEGFQIIESYCSIAEKFSKERNEMIEPIFKKLLEKGYEEKKLRQ
jgi:hypothetical protein